MTAQIAEKPLLDGEQVALFNTPLEAYFARGGRRPAISLR